jgi:hypothetical protein
MDKMTRIRMKTLRDILYFALKTCERFDLGTDPDGKYIAEMTTDKIEDVLMEIDMLTADDDDGSLVKRKR